MPPRKKTLSGALRSHAEVFDDITWDPANRLAHLERHAIDFYVTRHRQFDWGRIKKRKDTRYSNPDRFQAIVALRIGEPPRSSSWYMPRSMGHSTSSRFGSQMKKSVQPSSCKSPSATQSRPGQRLPRTDTDHAAKGLAELPRKSVRLLTPHHAAEGAHPEDKTNYSALADWVRRGMPQAEIVYTDDAPKLTEDKLAEFEPASVVIKHHRSR